MNHRLFVAQCDRGLDPHGSASGDVACCQGDTGQEHRHGYVRDWVGGADTDKKVADEVSGGDRGEKADRQAGSNDRKALA